MINRFAPKWLGLAILVAGFSSLPASRAEAQFGFAVNTPGLSVGVGQGFYGGYYPAPVVVPRPVVMAPPVVYGPRPYYGGYGYYGRPGGYYGGPRGPYGYGYGRRY